MFSHCYKIIDPTSPHVRTPLAGGEQSLNIKTSPGTDTRLVLYDTNQCIERGWLHRHLPMHAYEGLHSMLGKCDYPIARTAALGQRPVSSRALSRPFARITLDQEMDIIYLIGRSRLPKIVSHLYRRSLACDAHTI